MKNKIVSLFALILLIGSAVHAEDSGCLREISPTVCEAFQQGENAHTYNVVCEAKAEIQRKDSIEVRRAGGSGAHSYSTGGDMISAIGIFNSSLKNASISNAQKTALNELNESGFWPKLAELPTCENFRDLRTSVTPREVEMKDSRPVDSKILDTEGRALHRAVEIIPLSN
jgi:hypothetical protein